MENSPSRLRRWVLAARPKTLPAAAAPVLIGAGLASLHGVFTGLPVAAALVGALLIQVSTNFANDYADFVKGTDTDYRVGPLRVTQAGLLSPEAVRRGMLVVMALALAVGSYLVAVGGWPIVVIGLSSLLCAWAYTGGPYPLGYHGLGDVFVFVFFGLVAVGGTYWVQALALTGEVLWAGVGVGALSTAILVVNNLRDVHTDTVAGKRTLAVRIGAKWTQRQYAVLLGVGAVVPVVGVVRFGWPGAVLLASLAVLWAVTPLKVVFRHEAPAELLPALGQTARVVALYGLFLSAALAWG